MLSRKHTSNRETFSASQNSPLNRYQEALVARSSGGLPSGLDHTSTSVTGIRLDPVACRTKRMKRSVITAARLHSENAASKGYRYRVAFITLTYREGVKWRPYHITQYLQRVRKWLFRRGIRGRYVWVAELTKRGRLHYHIIWFLPPGCRLPLPDKQGHWEHGHSNSQWARNAVGYIAKYASKGEYRVFPKGARINGAGGLTHFGRISKRWWLAPAWARGHWPEICDISPAQGGGWVNRETGELAESPFLVYFQEGSIFLRHKQGKIP